MDNDKQKIADDIEGVCLDVGESFERYLDANIQNYSAELLDELLVELSTIRHHFIDMIIDYNERAQNEPES